MAVCLGGVGWWLVNVLGTGWGLQGGLSVPPGRLARMSSLTCRCCGAPIAFVSFKTARTGRCPDCSGEHDRRHEGDWRPAS